MSTDPADVGELAVGTHVRALDSEKVFASDPESGDEGEVVEASAGSYLVRWKSGSESWMRRANLEQLDGFEAEKPEAAAVPARVAGHMGRGRYVARYAGIIVFGLLTARGWIPALGRTLSHLTPRSICVILLVLAIAAYAVASALGQTPGMRRARAAAEAAVDNARKTPDP
jgi:hypothetical protein